MTIMILILQLKITAILIRVMLKNEEYLKQHPDRSISSGRHLAVS